MVTVLCYSVMDVGKDLYGPLDVIDVAKGLSSGSYNINRELNPWTKLEGQNDAVSKKTWQCFNQNVIETLGDLSYLTHKLNNEDKKRLIDDVNWECFTSPNFDLQNFKDKDKFFDLSALHESDTFSVVDIMFYNGETIYNGESMLSKGVHREHQHDDDERRSISESEGDTRRVILYTPKFVGRETKLKALRSIFGKMNATGGKRNRLWSTHTCVFGTKKGKYVEEYKNYTHKTACKVRVHISTEDEWPFVIIDGIHNHYNR